MSAGPLGSHAHVQMSPGGGYVLGPGARWNFAHAGFLVDVEERVGSKDSPNAGESAEFLDFLRSRGCASCNGTGYRGRTGVYELLEVDEAVADALRRNDTQDYLEAAQVAKGYRPLAICALEYASKGITSLDEVLRIAGETEDSSRTSGTNGSRATA